MSEEEEEEIPAPVPENKYIQGVSGMSTVKHEYRIHLPAKSSIKIYLKTNIYILKNKKIPINIW